MGSKSGGMQAQEDGAAAARVPTPNCTIKQPLLSICCEPNPLKAETRRAFEKNGSKRKVDGKLKIEGCVAGY
jgi:hypothetical protein